MPSFPASFARCAFTLETMIVSSFCPNFPQCSSCSRLQLVSWATCGWEQGAGGQPDGPTSKLGFGRTPIMVYYLSVSGAKFTWDPNKAESNATKHRVTFEEAVTVFEDPRVLLEEDGGSTENRFTAIGYSTHARVLYVVFLEFGASAVRIISARKATRHERKRYQEEDQGEA